MLQSGEVAIQREVLRVFKKVPECARCSDFFVTVDNYVYSVTPTLINDGMNWAFAITPCYIFQVGLEEVGVLEDSTSTQ